MFRLRECLRAFFLVAIATRLLLSVIQGVAATSNYCPTTKAECVSNRNCLWHVDLNKCHSVLPCALETNATACASNTWNCSWTSNSCSSTAKIVKQTRCSLKASNVTCIQDKTCMWYQSKCQRRPTIVLSIADDLAWYDVGWHNPRARTPVLDRLKTLGVELSRHYTARFCAPTRGMALTGRLPWRVGLQTDLNMYPASSLRCATSRNTVLLPQLLKTYGNYSTHAFGKWHLGSHNDAVLPQARGFDNYFGMYIGSVESYKPDTLFWTKECACPGNGSGKCSLFSKTIANQLVCAFTTSMINATNPQSPAPVNSLSLTGETAPDLYYAARVVEVIQSTDTDTPLFLYIAWNSPHHPVNAPDIFVESLNASVPVFGNDAAGLKHCSGNERLIHLSTVNVMDEANRRVVEALDKVDRFDTTIFVFFSDNGGNTITRNSKKQVQDCRFGMNYPLRGGKYVWFEGGIRTVAFAFARKYINETHHGTKFEGLISANDWKTTLLRASGVVPPISEREYDVDQWSRLSGFGPAGENRTELPSQVWLEHQKYVILFYFENQLWKVLKGYPYAGKGGANAGHRVAGYAHAEIEQPLELPKSELTLPIATGFNPHYQCDPYCLFNLDEDPQEFNELSNDHGARGAMTLAKSLIQKYHAEGVLFRNTDFCDKGYYPTDELFATDSNAIKLARSCNGFVPWLYANGTRKPLCD